MWLLVVLVTLGLLATLAFAVYPKLQPLPEIPGPPQHWLLGTLPELLRNKDRIFEIPTEWMKQYGGIYQTRIALRRAVAIIDPELLQQVMSGNKNFHSKGDGYKVISPMLGNGLISSTGSLWKTQRKIMEPFFHLKFLKQSVPKISQITDVLIEHWRQWPEGKPIDLQNEMLHVTAEVIGRLAFGYSFNCIDRKSRFFDAFRTCTEILEERLYHALRIWKYLPTPRNLTFRRELRLLDNLVYDIIDKKLRLMQQMPSSADTEDNNDFDLLDMMIRAVDSDTSSPAMSRQQLRDEVMTLLFAGHDTTASLLTWALYLIARHPLVEERLRAELAALDSSDIATAEVVDKLDYHLAVLKETLRLYPPAWQTSRTCTAEGGERVGEYFIPAGVEILIFANAIHRSEKQWGPNAELFDPDRWLRSTAEAQGEHKRHPMAYVPFSAGPRTCIGQRLGLYEARVVLAKIVKNFKIKPLRNDVQVLSQLTLKARGGMWVTLQPV